MSDVNPQVVSAINIARSATLSPEVIVLEGAGKAYQSVAQSMAIAVQDAADNLRNVNTLATTAMGIALAQLLATGEPQYAEVIVTAQNMSVTASTTMLTIGQDAAQVLRSFPTGAN
jgi:hypothetical protein